MKCGGSGKDRKHVREIDRIELERVYGEDAALDEEVLIRRAKAGDADAEEIIIRRYKEVVKSRAGFYFMAGSDKEDIVQEGMIGIFKAIRDFDDTRGASFHTFAEMCITRQIISAIKGAARKKHAPLNFYVPISNGDTEEEDGSIQIDSMLSGDDSNPEAQYLLKEEIDYIWANFANIFSEFEWKVWSEYISGKTQQQIAHECGRTMKSIDNAIQRIKKKIEAYLKK